jgi:hypothetical protein
MSSFKFDEGAFKKIAEQAVKDKARDMQRRMDRLAAELKGKPLETAKVRLQQEWRRDGGSITDPELTEYAQALIDGTRIVFEAGKIKW